MIFIYIIIMNRLEKVNKIGIVILLYGNEYFINKVYNIFEIDGMIEHLKNIKKF